MLKLKLTTIGNSTGIILPKELLERLHLERGDSLCATEIPDGIQLTPYDEEFAIQMEAGERIMREDREALRLLAQ